METTNEQTLTIIILCSMILLFGLQTTLLLLGVSYIAAALVREVKKIKAGWYDRPWFGMGGARA